MASKGWFDQFKIRFTLHNIKFTVDAVSADKKATVNLFPLSSISLKIELILLGKSSIYMMQNYFEKIFLHVHIWQMKNQLPLSINLLKIN